LFIVVVLMIASTSWAQTITVGTFNTHFLYPGKVHVKYGLKFTMSHNTAAEQAQWNQPGFRQQKFEEAVNAVAPVIAGVNSDVMVLTEVGDGNDVATFVQAISALGVNYPNVQVCNCTDPTGQKVAILSKFPLVGQIVPSIPGREGYEVEEDDPDEQKDTGVSKGMRVTVEVNNKEIHIYGLHLASERGGHEQDKQRIAQAAIVRRHAVPLLNAGEHVIIAGDMNDRRGQPTIRRLRGLDDMWPDLIQTGHWKFFEQDEEASRWTYEFRGELNQIDHVLLSYSLRRNQTTSIRTQVVDVPQQTNPRISDHRPIVVTIDLPQ
jgi:endonuclease/exonuclease/phosphatase family metal-dependent hydrolase